MARTRILHVSNRFEGYQNLDPYTALMNFRNELINDFKLTAKGGNKAGAGSAAEAKEIQTFLQSIKTFNMSGQQTIMGTLTKAELQTVLAGAINVSNFTGAHSWFNDMSGTGQERGERLEHELAAIIDSVLNFGNTEGLGSHHSLQLQTGAAQTNIGGVGQGDLTKLIPNIVSNVTKSAGSALGRALNQGKKIDMIGNFVTTAVNMKIDVLGGLVETNLSATASPQVKRLAQLLQHAAITAKNYASLAFNYFDEELKKAIYKQSQRLDIHFGDTASKRVMLDLLNTKFPYDVSISIYYYTMHSSNKNVLIALKQLRLVYELTGHGQTALDDIVESVLQKEMAEFGNQGANYLIYNDPGGPNIYVRSTADLIAQLYERAEQFVHGTSTSILKSIVSSGAQDI